MANINAINGPRDPIKNIIIINIINKHNLLYAFHRNFILINKYNAQIAINLESKIFLSKTLVPKPKKYVVGISNNAKQNIVAKKYFSNFSGLAIDKIVIPMNGKTILTTYISNFQRPSPVRLDRIVK